MKLARTLFTLVGLAIVGYAGYQIGIGQNIATLPAGTVPVMAYGHPYGHFGFGFPFFGFLFWILAFFVFAKVARVAFGHRRGWDDSGPGRHGGWGDPRSRFEDWHRDAHGEKPSSTPTPPA